MDNPRIFHIDTSRTWRGGQRQVGYLMEELYTHNISSHLICQPGSNLSDFCRNKNLPHTEIRMKGEMDIHAAFKIMKLLKRERANILHTHTAHALSIGLISKLLHSTLSLIYTKRVAYPIRKNLFSMWKYQNPYLDKIVCISDYIKNSLIEQGITVKKLITIPSGIFLPSDTILNKAEFKKKHHIPQDSFIIITIAALEKNKGYESLIEAAKSVIEKNNNIYFIALGRGKHENELKQKVKAMHIAENFFFMGFQTDVNSFLKISDLFVLPSKEEGLGSSILDAQAAGLPVIASKTGGIPQIIQNGDTGILVPVDDPKSLAKQIMRLKKNDKLRHNLSQAALESIKQFSIEKTIDKYISLYKKLIMKFL